MVGGTIKLMLSLSALLLFVSLLWQLQIADALPTLAANRNRAESDDDMSHLFAIASHTGAPLVKRSLHSTPEQPTLLGRSRLSSRHRHLKNMHASDRNSSPNLFKSTGSYNKNLRAAKRFKAVVDNRLKRFRMLDPDEFQELLTSMSHQTPPEQSKAMNGMDTVGGMQLENYWSRK
jgi:hypothetical protein